jgi:hypothetical protein
MLAQINEVIKSVADKKPGAGEKAWDMNRETNRLFTKGSIMF